jgi:hypothetical protein
MEFRHSSPTLTNSCIILPGCSPVSATVRPGWCQNWCQTTCEYQGQELPSISVRDCTPRRNKWNFGAVICLSLSDYNRLGWLSVVTYW